MNARIWQNVLIWMFCIFLCNAKPSYCTEIVSLFVSLLKITKVLYAFPKIKKYWHHTCWIILNLRISHANSTPGHVPCYGRFHYIWGCTKGTQRGRIMNAMSGSVINCRPAPDLGVDLSFTDQGIYQVVVKKIADVLNFRCWELSANDGEFHQMFFSWSTFVWFYALQKRHNCTHSKNKAFHTIWGYRD